MRAMEKYIHNRIAQLTTLRQSGMVESGKYHQFAIVSKSRVRYRTPSSIIHWFKIEKERPTQWQEIVLVAKLKKSAQRNQFAVGSTSKVRYW